MTVEIKQSKKYKYIGGRRGRQSNYGRLMVCISNKEYS